MNLLKPFRIAYIKTTNLTNGYHDNYDKLVSFYKLWSMIYDFSVKIDPEYFNQLQNMIKMVVKNDDSVLDVGCGTGLGTIYSSQIAENVTGVDISEEMIFKLKNKIKKNNIRNIKLINDKFPNCINNTFDTIISSFAIVHFSVSKRPYIYKKMYENLKPKGRIGLFTAQGEIAKAFEKKDEIEKNLKESGFKDIVIQDVADIYRIITAIK